MDEPLDLFRDVIGRMVEQGPGEIIVVINGARNQVLEAVCEEFAPLVRWTHTPIPGKRNAVMIGTELSTGDITVLVDSDTVWTPGTLEELLKPFADEPSVASPPASASSSPSASWITRWADWLENPARSTRCPRRASSARSGACPGAPSRSAARSSMRVMDKFMTRSSWACSSRCPTTAP